MVHVRRKMIVLDKQISKSSKENLFFLLTIDFSENKTAN